mgnify:CR=1 FL=1
MYRRRSFSSCATGPRRWNQYAVDHPARRPRCIADHGDSGELQRERCTSRSSLEACSWLAPPRWCARRWRQYRLPQIEIGDFQREGFRRARHRRRESRRRGQRRVRLFARPMPSRPRPAGTCPRQTGQKPQPMVERILALPSPRDRWAASWPGPWRPIAPSNALEKSPCSQHRPADHSGYRGLRLLNAVPKPGSEVPGWRRRRLNFEGKAPPARLRVAASAIADRILHGRSTAGGRSSASMIARGPGATKPRVGGICFRTTPARIRIGYVQPQLSMSLAEHAFAAERG